MTLHNPSPEMIASVSNIMQKLNIEKRNKVNRQQSFKDYLDKGHKLFDLEKL